MTVLTALEQAAKPMTYAELHATCKIGIDNVWRELQRLVAEKKITETKHDKRPYTYQIKGNKK